MNPSVLKGVHLFIILSWIILPGKIMAQCSCEGGVQPDSIVYTFTVNPTSSFSTPVTFPKFNASVGTLTCLSLLSNVTAVANLGIRNLDSLPHDYEFLYTQAIGISGPGGLSGNANMSKNIGPYSLDEYGGAVDSTHYGPDTTFRNKTILRTISNVTPYIGTGNVTINFTNTGSTLLLQGSNNYSSKITTYAWGDFRLSYYWCENSVLAKHFKSFSAIKHDNIIDLEWSVADDKKSNKYEIQISYDGRNFKNIGERNGNAAEGATTKYLYQYNINKSSYGKAYFRIKQSAESITSYSATRTVDLSQGEEIQASIYPNPAVRSINLNFQSPVTGVFFVQLINQVGQPVFSKNIKVNNASSLQLPAGHLPASGIYYLAAKEAVTGKTFTTKLLIRK